MILLLFSLLFGAVLTASPHRPITLHDCSLVKFDLNDLDNALHMYKGCVRLFRSIAEHEKQQLLLSHLQNKMDSAWIDWALQNRIDIEGAVSLGAEDTDILKRHQKLDTLMNELAIQAGVNREVLKNKQGLLGATSRIRRSLIESIKSKIECTQEDLIGKISSPDKYRFNPIRIIHHSRRHGRDTGTASSGGDHLQIRLNGTGRDEDLTIKWRIESDLVALLLQILIYSSIMTFIFFLFFKMCCIAECFIVCFTGIASFCKALKE